MGKKINIMCLICNKNIVSYKSSPRKTCSKECRNKYISNLYKGKKNLKHSKCMKGKFIGRKLTIEQIEKRQKTRMSNNGYNFSDKLKQKMSLSQKRNHLIKDNYGMKNKHHTIKSKQQIKQTKKNNLLIHTIEAKQKISKAVKLRVKNNIKKYGSSISPETRKKLIQNNAQTGKKCPLYSGKGIKVPHYNIHQGVVIAKSSYEKKVMEYFDKNNIDWLYEPKTFILSTGKGYTPDFYIINKKEYIEVKGFCNIEYMKKYDLFIKEYSHLKIKLWKLKDIFFNNAKEEIKEYKKFKSVKIKKIEEVEYNDYVYDIEIKDCPYFFANNIISHNSSFDMGIDDEIKYMFFFPKGKKEDKETDDEMDEQDIINKRKGLLKKNYLYVAKIFDKKTGEYTGEDKVVIKNLGIKKKSISPLSRKIFWEHLVPKIKEGKIKFSKSFLKRLIAELLEKDITLAQFRKQVDDIGSYKSDTSLQYQISKKYGPGTHFLIPNTKGLGIGKGKHFCTMEEFKEKGLTIDDIDLSNFWKELDYFIKPVVTKNIFDF